METAMPHGAVIGDIDVAQLLVAAFVLFFLGLVLYLRREDKREGYPLIDPAGGAGAVGFPALPSPKIFFRPDGTTYPAPRPEAPRELAAAPLFAFPGAPLVATGDPLQDGVGPAAYALRRDEPLMFNLAEVQLAPLRTLEGWTLAKGDVDPRGLPVVGADGATAGVVRDLWMDRGVKILRYLEVSLAGAGEGDSVLLPIHHTDIKRRRGEVRVSALRADQFAAVPRLATPDLITAREEDRLNAFYAGGRFFNAEARRGKAL